PSLVYELSATPTPKWELLDYMVVGLARSRLEDPMVVLNRKPPEIRIHRECLDSFLGDKG
ncbi:hypothetical protein Tco_0049893, partial [Tanacetum coccineum]